MSRDHRRGQGALAILVEGARAAIAQRVVSAMLITVSMGLVVVVLTTAGQSAAAERRVLTAIDEIGSRLLIVSDEQIEGTLQPRHVEQFSALHDVQWAFGVTAASSLTNAALPGEGRAIPLRSYVGDLPDEITIQGRPPTDGEVLIGRTARQQARMATGLGPLNLGQQRLASVGQFSAPAALESLNNTALAPASTDEFMTLRFIYITAESGHVLDRLQHTIEASVRGHAGVSVESAEQTATLRQALAGELTRTSRGLLLGVFGIGGALTAVVSFAAIAVHRQDLGRRRALGASRTQLITLALLRSGLCSALGALTGAALSTILLRLGLGDAPPLAFTAGIIVLTIEIALLATLIPAAIGARLDPVLALRVP